MPQTSETYFNLRSADAGIGEGGQDPVRYLRAEGSGVRILLADAVSHLSLLATSRFDPDIGADWRGLLIAEDAWPQFQPLLEHDASAIRRAAVWLQAEGKRDPVDPRPYRFVEMPEDICGRIDLSATRFDILDYIDVSWLRTGLAERFTGYPADELLLQEGIARKEAGMRVETADELRMLSREALNDLHMVRPNPLRFLGRPPRIFRWFYEFIVDAQLAAEIRRSAPDGVMLENAIIGV
jgi:hypothetical protein